MRKTIVRVRSFFILMSCFVLSGFSGCEFVEFSFTNRQGSGTLADYNGNRTAYSHCTANFSGEFNEERLNLSGTTNCGGVIEKHNFSYNREGEDNKDLYRQVHEYYLPDEGEYRKVGRVDSHGIIVFEHFAQVEIYDVGNAYKLIIRYRYDWDGEGPNYTLRFAKNGL